MARTSNILVGLLLFTFIGLCAAAVRFMQNPEMPPIPSEKDDIKKEGFKNAPTRAADCQCLPGYVPSNIGLNGVNGIEFQIYGLGFCADQRGGGRLSCDMPNFALLVFDSNLEEYILSFTVNTSLQNINSSYGDNRIDCEEVFEKIKRNIIKDNTPLDAYMRIKDNPNLKRNYKGILSAKDFMNKYLSSQQLNTYKCQSLADPADKRKCY